MKTGMAGRNLIMDFEKCVLTAYPDPESGGDPWTIGWGSTGSGISKGVTWTQEQADAWLNKRIADIEFTINNQVHVPLNQNQFDALVDFIYNVGAHAFIGSTLLHLINQNALADASAQFMSWVHAAGHISFGLIRRRQAERDLWLTHPA